MAIFIYSQGFCQKCAERKTPKKYFFHIFVLMSDLATTLPTGLRRLVFLTFVFSHQDSNQYFCNICLQNIPIPHTSPSKLSIKIDDHAHHHA